MRHRKSQDGYRNETHPDKHRYIASIDPDPLTVLLISVGEPA